MKNTETLKQENAETRKQQGLFQCFSDLVIKRRASRGSILFQTLIFAGIALIFLGGLIAWASSTIRFTQNFYQREVVEQVAEAGVEYYRWHLAHNSTDFQDGTGHTGPYVHPYYNAAGAKIGQFSLAITAPPIGSTVVKVQSTGSLDSAPGIKRVIETVLAKPSLAQYAVAANTDIRFGSGTEIFGKIHSNGGVHFDGLAHNIVTSAKTSYDDPDDSSSSLLFAVHTDVSPADPLPPAAVPSRPDVFAAGRTFPVPTVDFTGFTADMATIKATAQSGGLYLANSGSLGYHLVLKTNDTVDIYKVTATTAPPSGCTNSQTQTGWGSWSIQTQSFLYNKPLPANGALFVEDNVWVDGQINTFRVTIASARFPEDPATDTSITVNANLLYTNYDGQDVISLMAQNNVNIGLVSASTIRIDAALIAKNGRVGRYYYSSSCNPNANKTSLTLYGMIATNLRYGFAYTGSTYNCGNGVTVGSGYCTRVINYDSNLLYGPPPYFPQTADAYQTISWKEVK